MHPVTTVSTPESTTCCARGKWVFPPVSFFHHKPPPAPQHNVFFPFSSNSEKSLQQDFTAVLGASAITSFGTQDQKSKYLPLIASGEITTAIAVDEESHHAPANSITKAELVKDKWVLNGKKKFVVDGASADVLIILARTSGAKGENTGLTLFLSLIHI